MTTVVELEVSADRLAFERTFERVSSFEFRIAGLIGGSPLVRASGAGRRTLTRALEDDPSVDVIASLTVESDRNSISVADDREGVCSVWSFETASNCFRRSSPTTTVRS